MSFARWANFRVLKVSRALLPHTKTRVSENHHSSASEGTSSMSSQFHQHTVSLLNSQPGTGGTNQLEGLTVAMIVVFEFPPSESCTRSYVLNFLVTLDSPIPSLNYTSCRTGTGPSHELLGNFKVQPRTCMGHMATELLPGEGRSASSLDKGHAVVCRLRHRPES